MGLAVKTWLVLLWFGILYVMTSNMLRLSKQKQQPPEVSAQSYRRFTRDSTNRNTFSRIFRPLGCNPYAKDVKACAVEDVTNKTICLLEGCCFKDKSDEQCYHMTINRTKQILNILALGSMILAFIAICPLLFCLLTERTKLNPLLRKNQAVEQAKQKDMRVGTYVLSLLQDHKKKRKQERNSSTKTEVPSADLAYGSSS